MNADQVIEGIAKAVAAAKSAPEYCLFFWDVWPMCMTKSEWSGWMQAVGAVLAILGSFYLARRQDRKLQLQLKKSAITRIRLFVMSVSVAAETLKETKSVNKVEMLRQKALLRETITVGAAISSDMLSSTWIAAFEASRSIAVQLEVLCEAVSNDLSLFSGARAYATQHCASMERVEEVVGKPHPGVRFSDAELAVPDAPFFPGS